MSAEVQEESDAQKTAARGQRLGGRGGTSVGQTEGQPPERLQPELPQAWLLQSTDPHEDGEELWRQPGLSRQSEASRLALLSQVSRHLTPAIFLTRTLYFRCSGISLDLTG